MSCEQRRPRAGRPCGRIETACWQSRAHGRRAIAHGLEHGFHAVSKRRDRSLDCGPALLLRDQPVALLIQLAPLGDVLVRGNPSAPRHGSTRNGDKTPVGHFPHVLHALPAPHPAQRLGNVLLRVAGECVGAFALIQQLAQRAAGLGDLWPQPVHFEVALVAQNKPRRRIEHAQTFGHVVERGEKLGGSSAEAANPCERECGRNEAGDSSGKQRPVVRCHQLRQSGKHGAASRCGTQSMGPKALLCG